MLKLFAGTLTVICCLSSLFTVNSSFAEVVHSERSLYRNILVEDKNDLRCLKFNVKSTKTQQSCLLKSDPKQLVFNYTKQLFSGVLINPNPKRILIIGLGGGTMSNTLHDLFPESYIDNVEIDESVIKVAKQYFDYLENDHIKTFSQDGRVFVKRALLKKKQYDWIILDAFNGDYIPEHLMTKEYLQETKQLLSQNGILTANTFSSSELYKYESATYKAVFGDFFQVKNPNSNNRIILVQNNGIDKNFNTAKTADLKGDTTTPLAVKLKAIGVDLTLLRKNMKSTAITQNWDEDSPILTDQFSPANLLNL